MTDWGYSKFFVRGAKTTDELLRVVADATSGEVRRRSVTGEEIEVDVLMNDEADPSSEDFLYYEYLLDVVPARGLEREQYIEKVASLMLAIRQRGFSVVVASDFEDELPGRGKLVRSQP